MSPTLGQRLRALRIERGLSQADLAGDLVSPSYVSLIESDRRSPERDVLDGLARRLGCSTLFLESGVAPEELNEQRLRLQFAEIARTNGSLNEARDQFKDLLHAASGEIRYEAIWGLARIEEALGNYHEAMTHLEALLDAARTGEPGTPGLLTLFNARCRIYRKAGDYTRSIDVGEASLREVRALGLEGTEDEIQLASTLVASYWARSDLFSAQHLAGQVIGRAEKLGSRQAEGNAYWNASLVAAARGQLNLALELGAKTLGLLSESAPTYNLASMRVTYAWLLLRCDPPRLDEAEALLAGAREVFTALAMSSHLAACETEIARCALLRGNLADAIEVASQAIAGCADGAPELAQARMVSGLALTLSGRHEDGIALMTNAAELLAALGSRLDAAQAWREMAEALIKVGRSEQAIEALRKAADCAGARSVTVRADVQPALPVSD
ncbi:MAG TPA: helix-turn-helix transcriptional regulator [Streptosporangiaceae bacterium]